tara:strand:+ start:3309 stop:4121 length:813 start_codon:yes stop_codon:yes gene_type:complete
VTLPGLKTNQINGLTLSWREVGQGESLLLLHGIGGSSESWDQQFDYFKDQYRVIAWDMPGYGGSDFLENITPTLDDYVHCLERLVDFLEIKNVNVLGQSIAALVGARFCIRNPSKTLSYIFAHGLTGLGGLDLEERERQKNGRIEVFDSLGPKRFAYEKGPAIMGTKVSDEARNKSVRIMAKVRPRGFKQAVEMLSSANFFIDAPKIKVPSLILCGADDPVSPEKLCRSVQAVIKNSSLRIIPNVGHYSAIENPGLFNNLILNFLRDAQA